DWTDLQSTGFLQGLTPQEVISKVKACHGEATEQDVHQEFLKSIDDYLHMVTVPEDKKLKKMTQGEEEHERSGHLPKSTECPACIRESGSKIFHYKGLEPHYGTLYMDLGKINVPDVNGWEYFLVAGLRVRGDKDKPVLVPWL
ncbi:unnamed protein product, partial [Durusdinium trenchii]